VNTCIILRAKSGFLIYPAHCAQNTVYTMYMDKDNLYVEVINTYITD